MRGIYLFILSGLIMLYLLRGTMAINMSESLPKGIYYQSEMLDLDRGDLVLFRHATADSLGKSRGYIRNGAQLGKRIAAIPGDRISVGERVIVNGVRISGPAQPYDSMGRPMEWFCYSGVVPQGSLFVLGVTPDSFDSRYYGFVRKTDITHTLQPLLTWN